MTNCEEFDLVNKQTDANCCQLDCKLCKLFYFLVDLIFCHLRRSINLVGGDFTSQTSHGTIDLVLTILTVLSSNGE